MYVHEQMFQMALLLFKENTNACTYSLAKKEQLCLALLQAGSTKRNHIHVYILEQTPKSGYICIQFMLLAVVISRV